MIHLGVTKYMQWLLSIFIHVVVFMTILTVFSPLLLEILKMRKLGQQNTQRVVEENWKLQSNIQDMVDELDARNKQIEESEHDKRNLEQEKLKVGNFFHLRQNVLSTRIT
jgi:hypothetical protein